MPNYIIEVHQYYGTGYVHVGYMNRIFKSKVKPIRYLAQHRPQLYSNYGQIIDRDPVEGMRYTVIKHRDEVLNYPTFEEQDA